VRDAGRHEFTHLSMVHLKAALGNIPVPLAQFDWQRDRNDLDALDLMLLSYSRNSLAISHILCGRGSVTEKFSLTTVSLVLAPRTVHDPVADVAGRHAPSLAAVQGGLGGEGSLDRGSLDYLAERGGGRHGGSRHRGGRAGVALAASDLVAVIGAVQVTVASPIERNAPCAVALKATGAYCINESQTES